MMDYKPIERPPLSAWEVSLLRCTIFPEPNYPIFDQDWWLRVVNEPPEAKIQKPKEGEQQEEGMFERGKLILKANPARIDWLFTSREEDNPGLDRPDKLPVLGPFPDILEIFLRPIFNWFELDTIPRARRIAFGATLIQIAEDRKSGYRLLSTYLPSVELDPEGSTDFNYQINRPRLTRLGIEGLGINRLSQWSVIVRRGGFLRISEDVIREIPIKEIFACRLTLDINTFADFDGEFEPPKSMEIFRELIDYGEEIAGEGDIP